MLCSINLFRAFSTRRIPKRGVSAGVDADKLLNLVPVAPQQDGCATATEYVIENHFEKALGADPPSHGYDVAGEAAHRNFQVGGTRSVVPPSSRTTRRV